MLLRLWSFLKEGSKLVTEKKILYFVNRLNDEVIKVGHDFRKKSVSKIEVMKEYE